jgi:predicted anti-sigma-YlaC factor YlaD
MSLPEITPIRPHEEGHITYEALEQYAFKQLSEANVDLIEEHLLVCEYCRGTLDYVEDEIRALKEALLLSELEHKREAAQQRCGGQLFVMKASSGN